jgi:hypothetical protein
MEEEDGRANIGKEANHRETDVSKRKADVRARQPHPAIQTERGQDWLRASNDRASCLKQGCAACGTVVSGNMSALALGREAENLPKVA